MKKIILFGSIFLIVIISVIGIISCNISSDEDKIFKIHLNASDSLNEFMTYANDYEVEQGKTFEFPQVDRYTYIVDELFDTKTSSTYQRELFTLTFNGWQDEEKKLYKENSIVVTSDKTFTPIYTISSDCYQIELITSGLILKEQPNEDIYNITLPIIDDKNYIFSGWYRNEYGYGAQITSVDISNLESKLKLYAKTTPTLDYTNSLIASISDQLTINDVKNIHHAYECYQKLSYTDKSLVTNYAKLDEAYQQLEYLEEAKLISDQINELYQQVITPSLKEELDNILEALSTSSQQVKDYIPNDALEKLEYLIEEIEYLYNLYIEDAKTFDKKIALIPIFKEQHYENEITSLYNEYQSLDLNVKDLLNASEKLFTLFENLQKVKEQNVIYYFNTPNTLNVYTSKQQLFEAFFTDFYYYIAAYHGLSHLKQNDLNNVSDFVALAQNFYGAGASNLYGIGNIAGRYMLEKDVNGILENQTDQAFFGFLYQNNLYQDVLPFFINFFAYWRIDEKYANTSNYGADIFAESWAPTVDIAKFFYYNEETSYVKTPRMIDCLTNTASVMYNFNPEDLSTTPKLRGYIFEGWYDNEQYSGNPITNKNQTTSKKLYAKWTINQNQQDEDQANLTDVYIYNLTTSKAIVNSTTVGYVKQMYDKLSQNAKTLVKNYETLKKLLKQYDL